MKQKFRLRKEVCHLFEDKACKMLELHIWNSEGIPEQILEPVERICIVYGHRGVLKSGTTYADLSEWSSDGEKAKFHFTIEINGISSNEYKNIDVRSLMNDIQFAINGFMSERLEQD